MTQQDREAEIAKEIAAISALPRQVLIERWAAAYGLAPPKGISRRLLELAAAYNLQVQVFGGLKPAIVRKLTRIAEGSVSVESRAKTPRILPGTRLIREWNGRTQIVEVEEDGFHWNGRRWRSLSAIARSITGARWSGPRFFGL